MFIPNRRNTFSLLNVVQNNLSSNVPIKKTYSNVTTIPTTSQINSNEYDVKQTNINQLTNDIYTTTIEELKSYSIDVLEQYTPTIFNKKPKYIATCIETRFLPIMYPIILQLCRFLTKEWNIILYVSENVYADYKELFRNIQIKVRKLTYPIKDVATYNEYMLKNDFWKKFIKYERVLIFQSDTFMYRYGIEKFLEYDYVGAPWPESLNLACSVGNGGFTLRNPRACIHCIENKHKIKIPHYANYYKDIITLNGNLPEDVIFSQGMHQFGYKIPIPQIAQLFSIETVMFNELSIGSHQLNIFNPPLFNIKYKNSVIPYFTYKNPNIGNHRFGWNYVFNQLNTTFNNSNGIYLNTWCDCDYIFENTGIPNHKKWVGIFHLTNYNSVNYFKECNINNLLNNKTFINDLQNCMGIFTLSRYMKDYIHSILKLIGYGHIRICNLYHPIPFVLEPFNILNLSRINTIISIGTQLRRIHTIFKIKTKHRKIWLPGNVNISLYQLKNECKEYNITLTKEEIQSVKMLNLSNEEYDKALINAFIIIDLYDASANNALIECISRNIPFFVRKLPAVEEYIGTEYPLFFNSIEELEEKLENMNLIKSAYDYLQQNTQYKEQIKINRFISDILNSDITKYILSHS